MLDAAQCFDRHHLAIYRYFLRLTEDEALAEDLTQEVFVRIVRSAGRYTAQGREKGWVSAMVRVVQAEHARRAGHALEVVSFDEAAKCTRDPQSVVALGVREAIGLLPGCDQELLLLRELGGLSYDELAAVWGVSIGTVRTRMYRARQAVRRLLPGWGSERRYKR